MGCSCDVNNPNTYLACAGDIVRQIAPASLMMQYAAGAGASSANYSMCLAMMFLYARRMEYWKVTPGDCATGGTTPIDTQFQVERGVTQGLGSAAAVDPEPISKGILAGVAAIFGGFTAHHAQAVATEQSTLCGVTNSFNYMMNQLEAALLNGQIDANTAGQILQQSIVQLNASLNAIKSGQNAAWGYQIAMQALAKFAVEVVFPALQVSVAAPPPAVAPPPVQAPPLQVFSTPAMPQPVGTPAQVQQVSPGFNANNMGYGPTTPSALPFSLTPGTIVIIGGIAYVASKF